MSRLLTALLATSTLAACATAHGGHQTAAATQSSQSSDGLESMQQLSAQSGRSQTIPASSHIGRQAPAHTQRASATTAAAAAAHPAQIDHRARAQVEREDLLTQMAFWAGEYQTFPDDLEAAQKFAEVLRRGARFDRAVTVSNEALGRFPNDKPLMRTYGLAQIANHHPQEALRPLALIAAADAQDWKTRSDLGAALDQLGRFDEARAAYREALAIHPDDPGILTNLGVSHLMANEPDQAEPILRQASALPNAPPEARQNLAIALALQGKFAEAEQLQRIDLPPEQVAANMTYLRSLLADPHRWGDMRNLSGTPSASRGAG